MQKTLVITTIASSDKAELQFFASQCKKNRLRLIVIGDEKTPGKFSLPGCDYYPVSLQEKLPYHLSKHLPLNHYSRKNLGYLAAIAQDAGQIIETDDDNFPEPAFWHERKSCVEVKVPGHAGWINIYQYFTGNLIWPRGFPLELIDKNHPKKELIESGKVSCPIHQGLVNVNPDVDAVYRLTEPLPFNFEFLNEIALGRDCWCPFNSQNTTWFPEAFPLLYLPSFCNFRMTDIWRSFVAQRICHEYGWNILFHSPTVRQERNIHDLLADFKDEIPGYLYNREICQRLENLDIQSSPSKIFDNMIRCYQVFTEMKLIDRKEIKLLEYWAEDFTKYSKSSF